MSDIGRYIAKLFALPAYFMKDWRQDFVMPFAHELGLRPMWGDIIEAENYYHEYPKKLGNDRQSYIIGKTQSVDMRKLRTGSAERRAESRNLCAVFRKRP